MVLSAGLCIVIYVYYLFLYSPLSNKVTQKSTQLTEKIETLEWMKKVSQQSHSTKPKINVDNSKLLTILATQLKENESLEFPFQLQQTGSGEIQLSFDEVPLKQFLAWLKTIDEKYSISIKQFDVEHTERPGVTRLMMLISAG